MFKIKKDSLKVGTVPTFNLHLVGTLKNHFYQTDLLLLVHPVCVPPAPIQQYCYLNQSPASQVTVLWD